MASVYILINETGKYYVGITAKDAIERLLKHNQGGVTSTKFSIPWRVIYSETHRTYQEARDREK